MCDEGLGALEKGLQQTGGGIAAWCCEELDDIRERAEFRADRIEHAREDLLAGLDAGNNVFLLLVTGAITSFILGMGMTASACYIFVAITVAPALISLGLDPMAVHLYVFYWGLVSFITPPVALAAIAAASIAKADAMAVGFKAIRIGCLLFVLPMLFVLQPALILKGPLLQVLQVSATAIGAVLLLAAAFEGYFYRIGDLPIWSRIVIGFAGFMMLIPETYTDLLGLTLGIATLAVLVLSGRRAAAE